MTSDREIDVGEHPQVPWLSVVLGYGPMLPISASAVTVWASDSAVCAKTMLLSVIYAGSILAFLGGVRRGLSFRTVGGPALT